MFGRHCCQNSIFHISLQSSDTEKCAKLVLKSCLSMYLEVLTTLLETSNALRKQKQGFNRLFWSVSFLKTLMSVAWYMYICRLCRLCVHSRSVHVFPMFFLIHASYNTIQVPKEAIGGPQQCQTDNVICRGRFALNDI